MGRHAQADEAIKDALIRSGFVAFLRRERGLVQWSTRILENVSAATLARWAKQTSDGDRALGIIGHTVKSLGSLAHDRDQDCHAAGLFTTQIHVGAVLGDDIMRGQGYLLRGESRLEQVTTEEHTRWRMLSRSYPPAVLNGALRDLTMADKYLRHRGGGLLAHTKRVALLAALLQGQKDKRKVAALEAEAEQLFGLSPTRCSLLIDRAMMRLSDANRWIETEGLLREVMELAGRIKSPVLFEKACSGLAELLIWHQPSARERGAEFVKAAMHAWVGPIDSRDSRRTVDLAFIYELDLAEVIAFPDSEQPEAQRLLRLLEQAGPYDPMHAAINITHRWGPPPAGRAAA